MRTRIWHSDWKPRWLIRCVSAALLSFMDKQVVFCANVEFPRNGGAEGGRTPDLRIANATLSQLSYGPSAAAGDPRAGRKARGSCGGLHRPVKRRCRFRV